MEGYSVDVGGSDNTDEPPPAAAPDGDGAAGAIFVASLLYAVGDLHQLARAAPPETAAVIHAVADILADLVTAKD